MNASVLAMKCSRCGALLERGEARAGVCYTCSKKPQDGPRPFTPSDRALIARVHGYMPAAQLLAVLNERLVADAGDRVARYTLEQLHDELRAFPTAAAAGDWSGLRRVLAQARRDGVLAQVTAQVIDDFAVVFSLSTAQALRLKDIVLSAKEVA